MRRTAMPARKAPLRRTGGPERRKRLRPVSQQQRRRIARYKAARALVEERDRGICQRCGAMATECHHMGGRVGARMWDESLLVMLCSDCHRWATEHPSEAIAAGWSVRRVA